jgi:hypothetical protein
MDNNPKIRGMKSKSMKIKRGKNKKALSSIIATLIIIVAVLVGITITWAALSKVIEKGKDQIELGRITLNLEIKNVLAVNESFVKVYVKRNAGQGDLTGLAFVFNTDKEGVVMERGLTLKELQEEIIILYLGEVNVGEIKSISVAPILKLQSGRNATGNINDIYKISINGLKCESTCDSLDVQCGNQLLCGELVNCGNCGSGFHCPNGTCMANVYDWEEGLISWWTFDEDVSDSRGNNPGIINGATLDEEGKIGGDNSCYSFDGIDDYIDLGTFSVSGNELTLAAWVRADGSEWGLDPVIISKAHGADLGEHVFLMGLNRSDSNFDRSSFLFEITADETPENINSGNYNFGNGWHFLVYVYDGSEMRIYFDNSLVDTLSKTGDLLENSDRVNIGRNPVPDENGNYMYWAGRIDEPMIWERAITEDEINEIYTLFE